jgi:deazaflavin-dependent oxidoreductase (nitroreductase family)
MAQKYIRWIPKPRTLQHISAAHVWLYRRTGGLLGQHLDGLEIMLLTSKGRKTGITRVAPLPFFRDGSRLVLIASNGGRDAHPAWFHNVTANPDVHVQVGNWEGDAHASLAEGDERARLWRKIANDHPRYDRYLLMTQREIPVIVLELARKPVVAPSPRSQGVLPS